MTESTLPPIIPRSILFGNPVRTQPKLSPDGTTMAYLAPVEGVLNIWVGNAHERVFRPITNDRVRGIRLYFWGADSRHLIYMQDVGGDENWHIHRVSLETGEVDDLTPFEGVRAVPVARDKHFPDTMIVAMNRENPELQDAYYLDVPNGTLTCAAVNPGNVISWIADRSFRIRAAVTTRSDGGQDLLVRESEEDEWQRLISWTQEDTMSSRPVGFSRDGNDFYLIDSRNANAGRLVKVCIDTGDVEVLAEDPQYDVDDVLVDPDTYEIQAASFVREREEWLIFDDAVREDFAAIAALHEGDFNIYSVDDANRIWVIGFMSDTTPMAFWLYDRSTRTGDFLFYDRPELRSHTLAPMEPITYTARDGMTIHGYLTFPPGVERKNLPLVLNVHGGPWARDIWRYNSEAQWLANRGYACLQVNYRGSTGYGKAFLNAGNKEWGGKMHNDLVDAVAWAVEHGYADPERVAVFGGSYGGYAALVGATFTPNLFRCAVAIVGPSNLLTFIRSIPEYWKPLQKQLHNRVGDPDTEQDFLISRSPLFKVDQIKIPMLIAQGANDPRVKMAESEQIVEAMQQKNIPYKYMLFEDEGHGFARPENRMKFYTAVEEFLGTHLGGRSENISEEESTVAELSNPSD